MKTYQTPAHKMTAPRAAGFTLVEALVAFGLGGIMLLALYASFAYGFTSVRMARENLRATQILLKRMEGVRLCTFAQVTNATYTPQSFTEYYDPTDQTNGSGGGVLYTGTYSATVPTNLTGTSYASDMRLITVTVNWTNYNRANPIAHTRQMQSYVARNGIQSYVFGQ
jgi:type II secretory pathway pseudopilin PulG